MYRLHITSLLVLGFCIFGNSQIYALDEIDSLNTLCDALEKVENPETQAALIKGMLSGLSGRRNVTAPANWSRVSAKLANVENAEVKNLISQLSQVFGDQAATLRALEMVKNQKAAISDRRRALYSLLNQKNEQASKLLESLVDDPSLRIDAIRGFAVLENVNAPIILLSRYKHLSPEHKKSVIETLATRKSYAISLLKELKAKRISQTDIPAHVARSLSFILGNQFTKVYGEVRQVSADRKKALEKYKKLVTANALRKADPAKGRGVFTKTCASCHTLYGTGAKIGPDLTGSNRANLDYILLNSIDPSYDVPDGYKMVIIQTVDGRVLEGVIAEEDSQRVILKTVQQPKVVILKSDIENRKVSTKSMMPDGQLDQMKPQDVIDLIKYLRTTEQVEIAK